MGELELTTRMLDSLNTAEQQLFVKSFQAHLQYGQDDTAYVVDFDDVWKWVGFGRKDNAKALLKKNFTLNVHDTVCTLQNGHLRSLEQNISEELSQLQEQKAPTDTDRDENNNMETFMLTVNTFKKFCMKAATKRAEEICDYYIKMENILLMHTKDQLETKTRLLEEIVIKKDEVESMRYEFLADLGNRFRNDNTGYLKALELVNPQQPPPPTPSPSGDVRNRGMSGPRVQVYDGDDTTKLLHVFDGITDATREISDTSFTHVKFAVKTRTLYRGFRWHFLDRHDPNPTLARPIGETVSSRVKATGMIAMMDIAKTKIEHVFRLQKDAADHISQHSSAMCTAIKYKSILGGHAWVLWDDVDPEIVATYMLENGTLPDPVINKRGVHVQQLDPETNTVLKTFESITDVVKELKMSAKTIKKVSDNDTTYGGFKWKIV